MDPAQTRVGWIGTGVMGLHMCKHVLKHAGEVIVHNRTKSKAKPLIDAGARWADTPADVAQAVDVVFTIVGFPQDVREVYLEDSGILSGAQEGLIAVDMTTTEPSLAREIHEKASAQQVATVDAPVSGGDVGAKEGRLSIMVGGDKKAVEEVMPFFKVVGRNIVHQGPAGAGQDTKMCNQIVIAGTMVGMCEALLYGHRAGLDLETVLSSISGGAAGCWSLENLAPRICKRDFDPGFFVEHFIKDMEIALTEARRMNLSLPGLALVHQLYVAVRAQGHGKLGTHALMLALESMSDIEPA